MTPSGTGERLIRYRWNFGDGNIAETKNPVHTFTHAGMYVVVVESRFLKETALARTEVTVLPVHLSLARTAEGHIQVHNNAKYEIDLGGFMLRGDKAFDIPKRTILLPSATLTVHRNLIDTERSTLVSLLDPKEVILATLFPYEMSTKLPEAESDEIEEAAVFDQSINPEEAVLFETEPVLEVTETLPTPEAPMVFRPELPASVEKSQVSFSNTLPYLGLIVLLIAGILGMYVRK